MKRRRGSAVAFLIVCATVLAGCKDNMLTGGLTPVPPVHRVPIEVEGTAILLTDDPVIESKDPVHISRAKEAGVPRDFRESMVRALKLAGFKVEQAKGASADLEVKLALHVDESTGKVRQVYRCSVRASDGTALAQIDWSWPEGTYVDSAEVFDFATHHLANEVATAHRVLAHLRSVPRGDASAPAPAPAASSSR